MYTNALNLGDIELQGSGYLSLAEVTLPIIPGLKGAFVFGGETDISRNLIHKKEPATVVGSPVQHDGYCEMGLNNYLKTSLFDTADATLIVVGRNPDVTLQNNSSFVGSYRSNIIGGRAIFNNTSGGVSFVSPRDGSSGQIGTVTDRNFNLYAVRSSRDYRNRIDNLTNGTSGISDVLTPIIVNSNDPILIGRIYPANYAGLVHVSAVLVFDEVLDDTVLSVYAQWMRNYVSAYGIDV